MIDNPPEVETNTSSPSQGDTTQPKGRTAEDRINELLSKVKETTDELGRTREELKTVQSRLETMPVPTPPTVEPENPDVDKAVSFLKEKGKFVTEADVTKRLQAIEDRNFLQNQHLKLENQYDGADGRPKYDRAKAEEYMRTHPVYDPEIAYREIYKDELFDWSVKKLETDRKNKPYVARPSSTSAAEADNNSLTREKVNEWVNNPTPENKMKYEQNREKILKLMAEQKL